jgi:hypothetical protein
MPDPLSVAFTTLRRRYGPQALRRGDLAETTLEPWATGVPVLDDVLLPGGLPRGRITLLAAGSTGATGRLTLLQSMAAAASRSRQVGYVDLSETLDPGFLADLGADLQSCLVLTPGSGRWQRCFVMARALVAAGLPWLAVALDRGCPDPSSWEHALAAFAEAVSKRGAVAVISAPPPLPKPLAYASSLTLTCAASGWQRMHGDVTGLRVTVTTTKSKVAAAQPTATLLLRYPRPYAAAEVTALPSVVAPVRTHVDAYPEPQAAAAPG